MTREEILQDTLTYYGYKKSEADKLTLEIINNLNNYLKVQESVFKRLGKAK
jgi:hypothetical protein